MFSYMLFFFLGFIAFLALCVYALLSQEKTAHTLQAEHAALRLLLQNMALRLDAIEEKLGIAKERAECDAGKELLTLSFRALKEEKTPRDPALELHWEAKDSEKE